MKISGKNYFFCLFGLVLFLVSMFFLKSSIASEEKITCNNRYVTLINPVRGRNIWLDKSLKPIEDQYGLIAGNNLPATWLLQYDVLSDSELLKQIKQFNSQQEKGIFLEISPILAQNARVIYPSNAPWYSPKVVFLSGYSQTERRHLIDEMFKKFKLEFGFFPKSVGAWWIDSYSLQYMKDKYQIKSALIVADQKTTDNYGVWGQWWGVPYYPSKANILTPASNLDNKQNIVITQWAQRDLSLAHDVGPASSNYSLQANDYIRQGKNTTYFKNLISAYLGCQNPLGQITVGLETGNESVEYFKEYNNQLIILKNDKSIQFVTMDEFADKFAKVYPDFPTKIILNDKSSTWDLSVNGRSNQKLSDFIKYKQTLSFKDYFLADNSSFLNRDLPIDTSKQSDNFWFPIFLPLWLGIGIIFYIKKKTKFWFLVSLFSLAAFGLILRSHLENEWWVYYGPEVPFLILSQMGLIIISFFILWLMNNWKKINLWLFPLAFGLDQLLKSLRASYISDHYYLGFNFDVLRFVGLTFTKSLNFNLIFKDLPAVQSEALLRFDFGKIWSNLWVSLIVYPLAHIFIAILLSLIIFKLPQKIRVGLLVILSMLFFWYMIDIFQTDPRAIISAY